MNIKKITHLFLTVALLSSCEFNEDFCIRDGVLFATCDYSRIQPGMKIDPTSQHLIGYGRSDQTQPFSPVADFVKDTLEWSAPQGNYGFILYSGSHGYSINNRERMEICSALAEIDTLNGKRYYAKDMPLLSYGIFSEKLVYQKPVYRDIVMKPLTQQLIVKLHLQGNQLEMLDSIKSEIDGVYSAKTFTSEIPSGESATVKMVYQKADSDKKLWEGTSYVLGFSDTDKNIFRLFTKTSNNSDEFHELDLSPYLKGITQYKIIVNLDFTVGKELEINDPVVVESWSTGEKIEIEITPEKSGNQ